MSSTRIRQSGTPPPQFRYASSPAFRNNGLKPALVAARCAMLEDATHRELIWYLQARSHRPGELASVGDELREQCLQQIFPKAVAAIRHKPEQIVSGGLRDELRKKAWERDGLMVSGARHWHELFNGPGGGKVKDYLMAAEASAIMDLEEYLRELCLNPEMPFGDPWYFTDLQGALAANARRWEKDHSSNVARTSVGESLADAIRYAQETGSVVLFTMPTGTGKSFQARAYCERWPGRARYVQVPDGNDRRTFFAAIASAYGGPDGTAYKAQQLQERIEAIAQQSGLVTIFDDGVQLLPSRERETVPDRIDWLVTALAERNVPAVILTQASFNVRLLAIQERSTWSASSFLERVVPWLPPAGLEKKEIEAVARAMFPSADQKDLSAMAHVTLNARGGSLHFLEQLRRNISFVARKSAVTSEHVRQGIAHFSIPQANALASATATAQKKAGRKFVRRAPRLPAVALIGAPSAAVPPARRESLAEGARPYRETIARAGDAPAREVVPKGFAEVPAE